MKRPAFTLVELLVVIAIIGVLMSLLLPAVNSVREAARRAQCSNNIRSLAQACLTAEVEYGQFPSGGWSFMVTGDPDLGYGPNQPGGWGYAILPYIDQFPLYDLGRDYVMEITASVSEKQLEGARKRCQTTLPVFSCPTRRPCLQYPYTPDASVTYRNARLTTGVDTCGKTDYAANAGSSSDSETRQFYIVNQLSDAVTFEKNGSWPVYNLTGMIFYRSAVTDQQIIDGRSNTYLLGEKYLNIDVHLTGTDPADNECLFSGYNNDNHRYCYYASDSDNRRPLRDRAGYGSPDLFGSSHEGNFCMALADSSTRWFSYTIDPLVHSYLGNRKDGKRFVMPE